MHIRTLGGANYVQVKQICKIATAYLYRFTLLERDKVDDIKTGEKVEDNITIEKDKKEVDGLTEKVYKEKVDVAVEKVDKDNSNDLGKQVDNRKTSEKVETNEVDGSIDKVD